MASAFITTLLWVAAVQALPTKYQTAIRQSITVLTDSQIGVFTPYTYFAKAAYCDPSTTISWTCGAGCDNNKGFKPVASGGDGNGVQFWYVGYDPSLQSVVVAHQGTKPSEIKALLTDGDLFMGGLDSSLFPGLPSDIEVHEGFRNEQSKTAFSILSAVQTTMSNYGTSSVKLVGHSLGAALSLLDSIYLPLHLPSNMTFQTVLYGLPRVGNGAFADYVNANVHVTHVNNRKDPVPIIPGKFLGYVHPAGEVHIQDSGEWVACPGQDNPHDKCSVGEVSTVFSGEESNHDGPYNGISMPC